MKALIEDRLVQVTPEMLAEMFANMTSDKQARFFNHIDKAASTWPIPFCFQLQAITDEDGLTLGGRRVMRQIGDYSNWGMAPKGKG